MRCYPKQHQFDCGIDVHARTMYRCVWNQEGEVLLHRDMQAAPGPFLKAIAPDREDLVVCVECLFTWYWLADLCTQEGMPFVLGQALDMQAIHGGKAKNAQIDAPKMAVLRRGGMLPQADVDPAAMRATRDLLRRRMPLLRTRAALLAPMQQTNRQYNLPELGKQLAYTAHREGVAERFLEPAVHTSSAVDLTLIGPYDRLLTDWERDRVQTAKAHAAPTFYHLRSLPGVGKILALVRLYDIHDIRRFPRVQAFVSDGRLGTCAKASAGTRDGTSGTKIGHASRTWAFSEAAVRCLRHNPAGQQDLARLVKKQGQGNALTGRAHTWARAVYDMCKRDTAFDLEKLLHASWSGAGEPAAYLAAQGSSLTIEGWQHCDAAAWNAYQHIGLVSLLPAH